MINVSCPRCGNLHFADDVHLGKFLRCSRCGDAVQIGFKGENQLAAFEPLTEAEVSRKSKASVVPTIRSVALLRNKWAIGVAATVLIVCWSTVLYLRTRRSDIFDQVAATPVGGITSTAVTRGPSDASAGVSQRSAAAEGDFAGDAQSSESAKQVSTAPASYHRTGDVLMPDSIQRGRGRVTLVNGTGEDAVILLVDADTGELDRSIFISAGDSGTIDRVASGDYWVKATMGTSWSDEDRAFLQNPSYFKFPHPYKFAEKRVAEGIEYSKWSLTLHEVLNGNVHKIPITKDQFWPSTSTVR